MAADDDKVISAADRLRVLREAKVKREAARADYATKLEIETLELDEKLTAEHGPRGVRWTIVDTTEGPVGLVLGPSVLYKKLQGAKDSELAEELYTFVLEQVAHPSRDAIVERFSRLRGLVVTCGDALIALHKGQRGKD